MIIVQMLKQKLNHGVLKCKPESRELVGSGVWEAAHMPGLDCCVSGEAGAPLTAFWFSMPSFVALLMWSRGLAHAVAPHLGCPLTPRPVFPSVLFLSTHTPTLSLPWYSIPKVNVMWSVELRNGF